jgi:acyl-homoserine-lactone acylase
MKSIMLFVLLPMTLGAQTITTDGLLEVRKWREQSLNVKIHRDQWGIAHVYGKTDADAVFGMLYAQCEDDFNRVERNYLTATGRLAEALGEDYLYHDLRTRLFQDSVMAMGYYKQSPEWLKKLCNAFADGINYYLYTHPEVKPKLIKRFQPWMPFLFSEGSIGGDIETISLNELKEFYGKQKGDIKSEVRDDGVDLGMNTPHPLPLSDTERADSRSSFIKTSSESFPLEADTTSVPTKLQTNSHPLYASERGTGGEVEPRGSNGFAIAPSKTANGNALFLINPHTSFYFRSEIHVNSEQGLNSYGAVTWGQFFIYQGFNEHCGWMHTSSEADAIDEYEETVGLKKNEFFYHFGKQVKLGTTAPITIKYKTDSGLKEKTFTTYYTQHGPITGKRGEKWISTRIMREPLKALTQSYTRTKSKTYADFERSMMLRTNSSNNTVYADDQGNIAYWHGNYIPKRNTGFNWSKAVDGSNPETEYKGLHDLKEIVQIKNPSTGWIQNCNNTPFNVSGVASPKQNAFPNYMAPDEENPRGLHAVRVLQDSTNFTLDKLIAAAYDSYLPAFANMMPSLIDGYRKLEHRDTVKAKLAEVIDKLDKWNYRFSETSIETTLAIYWAQKIRQKINDKIKPGISHLDLLSMIRTAEPHIKCFALMDVLNELKNDFGTWQVPWGEVNRFQRITPEIEPRFDDAQPSVAVPFTSAFWGSLASYGARRYPNTKKMYGTSGNSFVAVVEFGKKLTAKSVMVGGESSNPASPNYNDQGPLYAKGQFKDVLFYFDDVVKNSLRVYYPGQ